MKWFRLAAEQGDAYAQNRLGDMFYDGQGVRKDFIQGYMWATLAVKQGHEPAKELLETLQKEMSPNQIVEGQRLAREWKAKGK